MSESRWNAEDIVDGGPLGGGPEKLVDRVESAIEESCDIAASEAAREAHEDGAEEGYNEGVGSECERVAIYLERVDFRKEFPGELCEDVGRMLAAKIREGAHRT